MSHTQTAPSQDVVRVTGLVKRYRELVALAVESLSNASAAERCIFIRQPRFPPRAR